MATRRITRNRDDDGDDDKSSRARGRSDYDETDDDKDYEEPRGRRRSRDDDDDKDDDRSSSRRRSRSRDDDEDKDDDRPSRSRRRSRDDDDDDDDKDERPRRGRSRDKDDDDDEERPRRGRDRDDDDDDEPKARRPQMKKGWGAASRARDANGSWASEVKLDSAEQVFKFLDDEPFVVYGQHWIDERKGKKSFVCLADTEARDKGKDCPLCAIGDKPRIFSAFNVLLLEPDAEPLLQVLACPPTLTEQLKDRGESKQGPLTEIYWALSRSGKGRNTSYSQIPVKERDLVDWDISEPLDDRDIDDLAQDAYTAKNYPEGIPSLRDMKEIAEEIAE